MSPLTVQLDPGGMWHIEIFFGLLAIFIAVVIAKYLAPEERLSSCAALLWGYVIIGCLYIVEYPALPFADFNTAFQASSGQTLIEALLIPFFVISIKDDIRHGIIKLFHLVIFYEIAMVWLHKPGLLIAASFDTALIACYLPFASPIIAAISLVTIFTHHGTTALTIIAAQGTIWAWKKDKRFLILIPIAVLIFYINRYHLIYESDLMRGSGERLEKYSKYMKFWRYQDLRFKILGSGPGTFMWLSMMLDKYKNPIYLCMHSDILQIIFELGIIGATLAIGMFIQAVRRSWQDTRQLIALFGCVAFMATYHPARFGPSAILLALIFAGGMINSERHWFDHLNL